MVKLCLPENWQILLRARETPHTIFSCRWLQKLRQSASPPAPVNWWATLRLMWIKMHKHSHWHIFHSRISCGILCAKTPRLNLPTNAGAINNATIISRVYCKWVAVDFSPNAQTHTNPIRPCFVWQLNTFSPTNFWHSKEFELVSVCVRVRG